MTGEFCAHKCAPEELRISLTESGQPPGAFSRRRFSTTEFVKCDRKPVFMNMNTTRRHIAL